MPFDPVRYSLSDPDGENNSKQVEWTVEVRPDGDLIAREVWCGGKPWNQCGHGWEPQPVIWPTWPTRSQGEVAVSGSPLASIQEYWSTVGNRLRDSAKWMAAMLGLAVATVIGTSPLAGMREHRPPPVAVLLGSAGLVLLGITMFLVLQVMRPQSVSYTDVQCAAPRWSWLPQRPLYKWRQTVESQQDLYLPCGVKCLTGLRQSMIIEEITLMALSRARATAQDEAARDKLCTAQAARAGKTFGVAGHSRQDRHGRGILQAAVPQQLGHLRWSPVRPLRNGGRRRRVRMAAALNCCPRGTRG